MYENEEDFDERDYATSEPIGYGKADEEEAYRYMDKSAQREFRAVVSDPSSSESEEEDNGSRRRQPGDFCEDPAVVRARREAQMRQGGRGKSSKPPTQQRYVHF